jgi:hypothetical protein
MKRPNITPGDWQVMADPEKAGQHPYHNNRFIATADAVAEDEGDQESWHLEHGSLIAQMRDGEHQAANAQAITAIPQLLAALECIWGSHRIEEFDPDISTHRPFIALHEAMLAAGYQF